LACQAPARFFQQSAYLKAFSRHGRAQPDFMRFREPNTRFVPANLRATALAGLLVVLASLLSCPVIAAQTISPRPVARLIGADEGSATYTRPRIVDTTENEAATINSFPVPGPSFEDASKIEQRAFEATNLARADRGLAPLAWDPQLCVLARGHSESMAQRGYFDHETPEGLLPRDRARAQGLRFRVLGENIAYNKGLDDPGAFAVQRWMISSGHRANILYVGFEASAIGSYIAADGSVYITQLFIAR
jgi:uncharacterized protein YkwD